MTEHISVDLEPGMIIALLRGRRVEKVVEETAIHIRPPEEYPMTHLKLAIQELAKKIN